MKRTFLHLFAVILACSNVVGQNDGMQYQIPASEYNALVDLYDSAGGPSWSIPNLDTWTDPNASWWSFVGVAGVQYDPNGNVTVMGHVTNLGLPNSNLTGTLPASLGNLTYLTNLYLNENQLTGPIPESIGNLSRLQYLDLSFNKLNGAIPESLGNLSQANDIELDFNELSGIIPPSVGNLSKLAWLYLDCNTLSGSIPDTLGTLSQLQVLGVSNNRLTNSIPTALGQLGSLRGFDASSNQLTGQIPVSLAHLPQLRGLVLGTNQLTGAVPPGLGNANFQYLDLSCNHLSGDVPVVTGGKGATCNLSGNWLQIRPGTQSLQNLQSIEGAGVILDYDFQGIGIDISKYTDTPSVAGYITIGHLGYQFVIVGGWQSDGTMNTSARAQLANARGAHLLTAGYCYLLFNSQYDGAVQVKWALQAFGSEAPYLGFLAIDVEDDESASANPVTPQEAINSIQQAVAQVVSVGLKPIIYTRKALWSKITGNSTIFSTQGIPLWWTQAGDDLVYDPDIASAGYTFGGWTTAVGKQFVIDDPGNPTLLPAPAPRIEVDMDAFDYSAFAANNKYHSPFPQLTIQKNILSWDDPAGILEEALRLSGPWTVVAGAASPFTIIFKDAQHFFRLH